MGWLFFFLLKGIFNKESAGPRGPARDPIDICRVEGENCQVL